MGTGAPTIPLRSPGAPTTPGAVPAPGPTIALPKATVQLQAPTQPLGTARPTLTQAPTLQSEDDEDEGSGETVANVLSIVGFIAALAVLAFQLMISNTWIHAKYEGKPGVGDKPPAEKTTQEWGELFQSEQ
jgi:hypothetical protein